MKALAAVVVAAFAAACAAGPPTLKQRAANASAEGKTVIVEFFADWCKVCEQFRRTVLPDKRIQAALADVRYVRVDAERGRGVAEAKRLGVVGYPTFFVVRADGEAVATVRGLQSVDHFLSFVQWGQVLAADESAVRTRLERGRTAATLLHAARWYAENARLDEALALYDESLTVSDDADAQWERSQVRSAGGTREQWARAAAEYVAAHPRGSHSVDAFRIALLSDGLGAPAADDMVEAYLGSVAEDAVRLHDAVYILLAAGLPQRAVEAATRLVDGWPKQHMFRDSLADAHAGRAKSKRAAAHRAWVAGRRRDLQIK